MPEKPTVLKMKHLLAALLVALSLSIAAHGSLGAPSTLTLEEAKKVAEEYAKPSQGAVFIGMTRGPEHGTTCYIFAWMIGKTYLRVDTDLRGKVVYFLNSTYPPSFYGEPVPRESALETASSCFMEATGISPEDIDCTLPRVRLIQDEELWQVTWYRREGQTSRPGAYFKVTIYVFGGAVKELENTLDNPSPPEDSQRHHGV